MSTSIFFNGNDLTKYVDIQIGIIRGLLPALNNQAVKVGTQNGQHFLSHSYDTRIIKIPVSVHGSDIRERLQGLACSLNVNEPKPLIFDDQPDRYWLAVPSGDSTINELYEYGSGTLEFTCFVPYAIGTTSDNHGWDQASDGAVSFFANLNNKISGNTQSNPNAVYENDAVATNLEQPSYYTQELCQSDYLPLYHSLSDSNDVVDSYAEYSTTTNGNTARMMVKFNLINALQSSNSGFWKKYEMDTVNDQVTFIKKYIQYLEIRTWACGNGNGGYGADFQFWNGTDWTGTHHMDQSQPTYWMYQLNAQQEINQLIDDFGNVYALISASHASDGNTPSTVKLGYIDIRGGLSISGSDTQNSTDNTVTIDYEGTYPTPITVDITNKETDNGFLGVVSADAMVQVGNPTTPEASETQKSERLVNDTFNNGVDSSWTVNQGKIFFEPSTTTIGGSWGYAVDGGIPGDADHVRIFPWCPKTAGKWNGPSITKTIPKDSSGTLGARNFVLQADVRFSNNDPQRGGVQELIVCDADGNHLMGISFRDETEESNAVNIVLYVGDNVIFANTYQALSNFTGRLTLQKFGSDLYFKIDKIVNGKDWWVWDYHWNDDSYKDKMATQITFWDGVYADHPELDLGLFSLTFDKYGVDQWTQNPNCFHAEDHIKIACDDHRVLTYVNNALSIENQDVGSKPIMLYPGKNIIKIAYSSWSNRPDVNITYTPRYI